MTPWEKMFREETEMSSAGVSIWTFLIFGGVAALVTLYLLETYSPLGGVTKGLLSVGAGVAFGYLAASSSWIRWMSQAAVVILILIKIFRAMLS